MQIPDCYDPILQEERRQDEWDRKCSACPQCSCCGSPVLMADTYLEYGEIVLCEECVDKFTLSTMDLEV